MKQVLSPHQVWDLFSKAEVIVSKVPSEDVCHQLLMDISQTASQISDPSNASNFESQWRDISEKMKPFADTTTFNNYKKEIEQHIFKILDPECVECQ